jgi:hypothetical protein
LDLSNGNASVFQEPFLEMSLLNFNEEGWSFILITELGKISFDKNFIVIMCIHARKNKQ